MVIMSYGKRKGLPEVEICQKGRLIKMTSFEGRIKGAEGGFKMYDNYKKNVFKKVEQGVGSNCKISGKV